MLYLLGLSLYSGTGAPRGRKMIESGWPFSSDVRIFSCIHFLYTASSARPCALCSGVTFEPRSLGEGGRQRCAWGGGFLRGCVLLHSPFPALRWAHVDFFPVFIFISGAELVVMVVVVIV